jgi:hypothetical protein
LHECDVLLGVRLQFSSIDYSDQMKSHQTNTNQYKENKDDFFYARNISRFRTWLKLLIFNENGIVVCKLSNLFVLIEIYE